jgi:hypothetical protein
MKRLMILSVLLAFISYCQAQDKKVEVPAAAKSAFAAKFPQATKVNWSLEKAGEYEADFILGKVETSAVFDTKGTLLETETEIKESELPQAVKNALVKDFAGYKLDEVEKSDIKGIITYEMEAKKDGKKYEVVFNANGKLLKKEEAKKEKDGKD